MNNKESINKALNSINPGRRINMEKICPYLSSKCIGQDCNAFVDDYSINTVNQKEIDNYIENGMIDWQKEIEKDDWKLNTIIETPNLHCPNEKFYIFTRKNYREFEGKFGRCVMGCVK